MDTLTTRRLIAAILPLISLGLIIGAVAVDDWYSISYIKGVKDIEEIWEEHDSDYGLQGFQYLRVWSGIFGDNFYQENCTYTGSMNDMFSNVLNSSIILTLLHFPLLLFCALVAADRTRPWLPMIISIVIFLGIISTAGYYYLNIEEMVDDHVDASLEPMSQEIEDDIKIGLKDSGSFGLSFKIYAISALFPLLSFLLLIERRSEKKPSRERIEDGFFK